MVFILVSLPVGSSLFAQKKTEKISTGVETVVILPNMSFNAAISQATYLAKQNAIVNAFGTYVGQEYTHTIQNGKLDPRINGKTKIEGIWIRTLDYDPKEGQRTYIVENKNIVERYITVTVKGVVRKLEPRAALEYKILKTPSIKSESTSFTSGDDLYLYFNSPVDGYLAVFIDEGEITRKLLPYSNATGEKENCFKVMHDSSYIFFDKPKTTLFESNDIDEITLFTDRKEDETNTIYIVFSEREFKKPGLQSSQGRPDRSTLPEWLKSTEFNTWLEDNRAAENSFQDVTVWFTISPKK